MWCLFAGATLMLLRNSSSNCTSIHERDDCPLPPRFPASVPQPARLFFRPSITREPQPFARVFFCFGTSHTAPRPPARPPPQVRNDALERALVSKHVRSLSGVLIVTVLTSPYPEYDAPGVGGKPGKRKVQRFSCKHNCYYCPNEPAHEGNNFVPQPRSYLHDEPGVRRANRCGELC